MSVMKENYFEFLGEKSTEVLNYVGLVDENGDELDYTNTIYSRLEVTWEVQNDGTLTPTADLSFDVPGSNDSANPNKVAGFRLYDQETDGVNYGGKDIQVKEYTEDGNYTLPQDKVFINFANEDVQA